MLVINIYIKVVYIIIIWYNFSVKEVIDLKNKEKFMKLKENLNAKVDAGCRNGTCCSYVINR